MLPLSSGLPTISGAPTVGSKLTASSGTWDGPTASYAYQWNRCDSSGAACLAIATATTQTYILAATDAGSTLRVAVAATNKNGSAVAISAATAPVTVATPTSTTTSTWSTTTGSTTTTGTTTTPSTSTTTTTTTTTTSGLGASLPSGLSLSTGLTFYVSTTGSDSNPGTLTAPWRTIQKALNVLQPGQQALVRAGTYTQDLMMSRSGTATAPITVASYPGETVILHAASTSGDTYPVQITGAYFRLQGMVIENSLGTSAANVYLSGSANHIELTKNEIRYGQDQGVFADNTTSYLQFLGNRVHDNGRNHVSGQHQSHAFYVEGSHDLFANNLIYNHPYGFGLQIYPANHDTVVVDNTVVASAHSSIVLGGSGGVYNITIRNNILYGDNWGVEMDTTCPTGPVTIDNNVMYAYSVAPIQGGCSSVVNGGNILSDPMFVAYASRDLQLQSGSPAVDKGTNAWSATSDFNARSRPQGAGPDIGAFER
jgi:hypothetical protein